MWATSDGPRVEDFGITEDDLAHAPRPFLPNHRLHLLAAAYLMAAVVVFCAIFVTGDSMPAAALFTAITLAAGSVILLPALVFALCVGERAEERWLCRRIPIFKACLAYQRAMAEHRRGADVGRPSSPPPAEWFNVGQAAFVELTRSELEHRRAILVRTADREESGFDLVADHGGKRVLVRCEAGLAPVGAAVGRELAAAVNDFSADAALIVAVSDPTAVLEDYIADRPINLVAPWALDEALPRKPLPTAPNEK